MTGQRNGQLKGNEHMPLKLTGSRTTIVTDWGGGIAFWMRAGEGSHDEMIWVVVTEKAVSEDILPPEQAQERVQQDRESWEHAARRAFDQHGIDPHAKSPEGKRVLFVYPSDLD